MAEYEILVGQTIRDISNPEGIGYEDFCIRVVDGKKLVILVDAIDNHNFWLKARHVLEMPFIFAARKRRLKL